MSCFVLVPSDCMCVDRFDLAALLGCHILNVCLFVSGKNKERHCLIVLPVASWDTLGSGLNVHGTAAQVSLRVVENFM
jgi:hypothetical protein